MRDSTRDLSFTILMRSGWRPSGPLRVTPQRSPDAMGSSFDVRQMSAQLADRARNVSSQVRVAHIHVAAANTTCEQDSIDKWLGRSPLPAVRTPHGSVGRKDFSCGTLLDVDGESELRQQHE